jgi:hypothetical protein
MQPVDPKDCDHHYRTVAPESFILLPMVAIGQVYPGFPHGFSLRCYLVCVMDNPVEDGVGRGGLAYAVMPFGDGELTGDEVALRPWRSSISSRKSRRSCSVRGSTAQSSMASKSILASLARSL